MKNGQSRETGNIGYTRHRMKTNKTEGAMKNGQSRETGNIGYATHRTKTNKTEGQ
jgi:quinol monooxygenase YgiN